MEQSRQPDKLAVASEVGATIARMGAPYTCTADQIATELSQISQVDIDSQTDEQLGFLIAHRIAARQRFSQNLR